MNQSNSFPFEPQRPAAPVPSQSRPCDEGAERILFEVQDYSVVFLDLAGSIITWNKGNEKISGYEGDEIVGKSHQLFYLREDVDRGLPDILLEHAKQQGKASHEGWRIKKNGHRFWGHQTITALHDTNGTVTGYLNITADHTEKKISEDRYANMLEELRIKNDDLRLEEQRYHKMVAEVHDYAIILLDIKGNILDWNKGAERVKGYTAQEIIGKHFRLFYPKEDKESNLPQQLLDQAAAQGFVNHEGFRLKKDGSRFWGSVAITALHDDHGEIIGFSKVTKDLTERKAADDRLAISTQELQMANERLQRSEERFHKMISEVQDYAILLLNTDGEIQNWNAGAQLIKGYEASEIVGKNFRLFYLDEDIESKLPDRLLREARETGRASNEGWRRKKDGAKFWASVVITALHDARGNVIGFSKVTRDLTERKKAEHALEESARRLEVKNQELETLNAELSSFAYVVSHDFKEPIRKIQVFAGRQLEDDKPIDQLREYSQKIVASAIRMQKLMESLLLYSRVANYRAPDEMVDLNEVVTAVKSDLELMIDETGAVVDSDTLPVVNGVPFQLHQMFLNLMSNAIRFAKPDTIPQLEIKARAIARAEVPEEVPVGAGKFYRLTFSDQGVGFESTHAEKIFDVFSTLQPKRNVKSTGIGLAIVKRVVQNHNGCVVAESNPGEGARFHVYLPAQ